MVLAEELSEKMETIIALNYFHRKIGPLVFYSYPDGLLDEDLSIRIANIMDQTFSEGFFTHSFETLNSINYYFEIHSDWARGNKEMLMISFIFDQQITTDIEQNINTLYAEFSETLQNNEEIFTAFYINDLNNFEEEDRENIVKNNSLIKKWVKQLYKAIIEETREKSEEEKIAILLNKEHIFKTLEYLSEGPKTLESLSEWFQDNFPNKIFDDTIDALVEKQFIFINKIGRIEKYVLLMKEVNAERIPPDSVIVYIDETPELIDLLLPKVQDYFSTYMNKDKEEIKEDSFTLFQIISDPKKYNVLSELRNGLIIRDELPKLLAKKSLDSLIENIDFFKKNNVIEELRYNNETYVVLKTNIQITTNFPKYLSSLLPQEVTPVIAEKYSPKVGQLEEIEQVSKDRKDRGKEAKKTKISTFLGDLSPKSKKKEKK